jgi:hypothetical protein
MTWKFFMLGVRLTVRTLARLGPVAEKWDRALTPDEHLNKHQIQRRDTIVIPVTEVEIVEESVSKNPHAE